MNAFFRKNESENNEIVSKIFVAIYAFILLIGVCCFTGIFDLSRDMILFVVIISAVPLALPVLLIHLAHINKPWMKYLLITLLGFWVGACYCIFTFQAILVFVIPSIVAALYMDKRLLYYSGFLMTVVILLAHVITGVYLFQPWIEPFTGMKDILQYGALPRCMQYLLRFGLLVVLNNRYLTYMQQMRQTVWESESEMEDADKKQFEHLLTGLTERERDVFLLMIGGATNMQIADQLCLSMGTVKNYV